MRYWQNRTYTVKKMPFYSTTKFVLPVLVLVLSGCASNGANHRPAVSNTDLANYETDLKTCQEQAANNEELDNTTEGAIAGATAGVIAGAITDGGDVITNAVVGALVGVAGGSLYTNEKEREYIIQCMQKLGYNVVADE